LTDRRTDILDGALRVLAEQGMRGLTHRAVDGAAGLSPGSTSYYFRSRAALVAGCVDRLLELDMRIEAAGPVPTDPDELVEALVGVGISMATGQRHRTLARYELSLAAVRDPLLRSALIMGGDTLRRLVADALAGRGVADPAGTAEQLAAVIDGLVFTALLRGPADPADLTRRLRPVIERILMIAPAPPRA
jgi:AcrR family transcriptional regulator